MYSLEVNVEDYSVKSVSPINIEINDYVKKCIYNRWYTFIDYKNS